MRFCELSEEKGVLLTLSEHEPLLRHFDVKLRIFLPKRKERKHEHL